MAWMKEPIRTSEYACKGCCGSKDQWDEFIDTTVFAYNTSCHESTCYSSFEVIFGRKAVLPIQINVDSSFGINNRYVKTTLCHL